MKTLLIAIALFGHIDATNAQNTTGKNLGDFNAIEVDTKANITLIQSDSDLVSADSQGGIGLSSAKVKDGTLIIHSSGNKDYIIKVKHLTNIDARDASVIKSQNTLTGDKLKIVLSDASSAHINVATKYVAANVKDASTLKLSGTTDSLNVSASDASIIQASDLKADYVTAMAHDAGVVKVWANKKIAARATGSGVISYKGDPAEKSISTDNVGVVKTDKGTTVSSDNDSDNNNDSTSMTHSHNFGDGFIGFGFVLGPDNNGGRIKYGKSREFNFGFGGGYKFFKWNGIGADIYYKSTGYYLVQDSTKIMPDNTLHSSEKIAFNNFGGLVFDRFFIGKMFFDGGFYYDWTFHTRHVSWDNHSGSANLSSSTKTIDRQLVFANPSAYGLTFRFGSQQGFCFYFNYRMSNLFKQAAGSIAGPPEMPPYTLGIDLGGF